MERVVGFASRSGAGILSEEFVRRLIGLHEKPIVRPFEMIRDRIERELRAPLDDVFDEFAIEPVTPGCLTQVHSARLKDGRRCAVKVKSPEAEHALRRDIGRLQFVLRRLRTLHPCFDGREILREVIRHVPQELDLRREAANMNRMRSCLGANPHIVIPRVHRRYSTRRVLTSEWIDGIAISDVAGLDAAGIDRAAVAQRLFETYCEQVLVHGLFHADPQPGNIHVQPGPKLVFLDFGLVRGVRAEFRENLARLILAIFASDDDAIVDTFRALGVRTAGNSPQTLLTMADLFLGDLVRRNRSFADRFLIQRFLTEVPLRFRQDPLVAVPGEMIFLVRTMAMLNVFAQALDSRVDVLATIQPYALNALAPSNVREEVGRAGP